ncbi:MAG: ribonuclease HI [Chromatiales bacterium]|nr:ribonuclease HI [Chromatiales bacterium]
MKSIHIYTDGACSGNPGPGGWAALLIYGKHQKMLCGGAKDTTNNRMELTAAIQGLTAIKQDKLKGQQHTIYIITDSRYLKDGIELWLAGWKKNNWHNSQKKIIKNVDLWMQLDQLNSRFRVKWEWVKGHSGHPKNEYVDQIAKDSIPR